MVPGPIRETHMRWFLRLVGLAAVVTFAAAVFTPAVSVLAERWGVRSRVAAADAIVVLGGGVDRNGQLGDESLRRAVEGIRLYRQELAPLLVLLGPSFEGSPTEASVRATLAGDLGVPREAIITVEDAFTTREEAQKVGERLGPRGLRRILLVTEAQHLDRAVPLFTARGFDVLPAATDDRAEPPRTPEGRLKKAREVAQELCARLYHRLAGYL